MGSLEVHMGLDRDDQQTRSNLFGGTGAVQIWNCLPSASCHPFTAALWCELEPGGHVGRHRQTTYPEVILCVGGTGRAIISDQTHPMVRGTLVHLPLGANLSLHNDSAETPLEYVIIKAAQ